MALSAGLARGAMDWAGLMPVGSKAAGPAQEDFRRQAAAARRSADQYAMQLAELVQSFHAEPESHQVELAFMFPDVSAQLPPGVAHIRSGVAIEAAEAEALRLALEQRATALSLCRLAGAGSDTTKARAFFTGKAKLGRAAFEWYLAQELDAISVLYSPQALDQPARARLLLSEASTALAAAGDSPEARKLATKIAEELRKTQK